MKELKIPRHADGTINAGVEFIPTFSPHAEDKNDKLSIMAIIRGGQLGMWSGGLPPQVKKVMEQYSQEQNMNRMRRDVGTKNRSYGSGAAAKRADPMSK